VCVLSSLLQARETHLDLIQCDACATALAAAQQQLPQVHRFAADPCSEERMRGLLRADDDASHQQAVGRTVRTLTCQRSPLVQ